MSIKKNHSLRRLNTFGLEVSAKFFTEIQSVDKAVAFFKEGRLRQEEHLILGGGSNILFSENFFDGLVIRNNIPGIHVVKEDDQNFWVKAGGGVVWHSLVESCLKANFGGIENLSLIPGTVGAAPIQNIGAYGVELKDVFEALEAIDVVTGEKRYFRREECQFGYRASIFKRDLSGKYFISNVVLKLSKHPVINTSYGNIREHLDKLDKKELTIRDVSGAIIQIRKAKLPDPEVKGNAGSFFKNPVVPEGLVNDIKKRYPQMPSFDQTAGLKKVPAAWLIDQCELKGTKHNGASVHTAQPLVIINDHQATGQDLIELSKIVQEKVKQKFNIKLEPEVRIV